MSVFCHQINVLLTILIHAYMINVLIPSRSIINKYFFLSNKIVPTFKSATRLNFFGGREINFQ